MTAGEICVLLMIFFGAITIVCTLGGLIVWNTKLEKNGILLKIGAVAGFLPLDTIMVGLICVAAGLI